MLGFWSISRFRLRQELDHQSMLPGVTGQAKFFPTGALLEGFPPSVVLQVHQVGSGEME